MNPVIAIHDRPGSFSDRWIDLCKTKNIPFKIVDCLKNDCVRQLDGCEGLLWHWSHSNTGDLLAAKAIIQAAEMRGIKVFPSIKSCWHFDDKISQKYLLETIGAPLVPTHVFYSESDAYSWAENTQYPKVFKLSRGASSSNVGIVKNGEEARKHIKKSFGSGIECTSGYFYDTKKKIKRLKQRKDYVGALFRMPLILYRSHKAGSRFSNERNYVYFQDFIPGNTHDTRITIIGRRAFGFVRYVRDNDFRASGSGMIDYSTNLIDKKCITTAFRISRDINCQSLAVDFVKGAGGEPLVLEVSYGFCSDAIHGCPGYWDDQYVWHAGQLWPQDAILDDFLDSLTFKHTKSSVKANYHDQAANC